jgi:AhpD family alkylhydroperoxidase
MTRLIEAADACAKARAVHDDIKAVRGVADVNNFWKALAVHPPTLARIWDSLTQVMAPGALDPLVKEMLYLAVSMTNGCAYCTASHAAAARAKGMTEAQYGELLAVVGMASETNRLAEALRVPIDPQFE